MLLSMSKLSGSSAALSVRQQTPQDCLQMMEEIERNFTSAKIEFKFLYTDALYLNKDEQAAKTAERVLLQMARHQEGFKKVAGARNVEFMSWNQIVLDNNQGVESALVAMRSRYAGDKDFAKLVNADTLAAKRGGIPDKYDVEFILQELAVIEMIRRNGDKDTDKVIVAYPGPPLQSDLYLRDKKHPLGKAAPVGHQAFWADVSQPEKVDLHAFALPQKEEKSAFPRYAVAASVAVGVFAAAAGGMAALTQEAPEPYFNITEAEGGVLIVKNGERTVIIPERNELHRQIVVVDGKRIPNNTRADGDYAYSNEKAVREYLALNR